MLDVLLATINEVVDRDAGIDLSEIFTQPPNLQCSVLYIPFIFCYEKLCMKIAK